MAPRSKIPRGGGGSRNAILFAFMVLWGVASYFTISMIKPTGGGEEGETEFLVEEPGM